MRDIPRDGWKDELDSFSRQHEGWIVSVETRTGDGSVAVQAHDAPLRGVSLASPSGDAVAVSVGAVDGVLTHEVCDATALKLELTKDGAERALVIDSGDGSTTTVQFRSPMRPEDVDGVNWGVNVQEPS
jgi:hypothetical protein